MKKLFFITIILGFSCGIRNDNSTLLSKIFYSLHKDFPKVVNNPNEFRVQIIYTQIDRNSDQIPAFTSHKFNIESEKYFYPASTVKFPAAVLALEKINRYKSLGVTKDSKLIISSDRDWAKSVNNDTSSVTGNASIAQYIKKIFVVSDNDAFNRIYDFLGHDYLNERMWAIGYPDIRFRHRLSIRLSPEENKYTNSFDFFSDNGTRLLKQPSNYSSINLSLNSTENFIGDAYLLDGEKINGEMNFSQKNFFKLIDQHQFLIKVMFPDILKDQPKLLLDDDDYDFLYEWMSKLPKESEYPYYSDYDQYPDGLYKFFMFGDNKDHISPYIKIFNKVGMAYGFLTDNAYIIDISNGIEFFLSAVIYVNSNGVLNDDNYEYEDLGLPFLSALGQKIYQYEFSRKKQVHPKFPRFIK
tara:strand:+ start:3812 stop:5047 length:1236 start_codon:yes stop_codon:yes gene_type:complete